MRRLAFSVACAFLVSGLVVTPIFAGGGGFTGGATEMTQLLNKGLLADQINQMSTSLGHEIEMLQNDLTMIQDMLMNTAKLPGQLLGSFMKPIQQLIGKYNDFQGLLAKLSNIDEKFYNAFYSSLEAGEQGVGTTLWTTNYSEAYFELSKHIERRKNETVKSLGISAKDVDDSAEVLAELTKMASNAEGRNAILGAGNEFAGFMSGELIKIRALLMEMIDSYLTFASREQSIQDANQAFMQKQHWDPDEIPVSKKTTGDIWSDF